MDKKDLVEDLEVVEELKQEKEIEEPEKEEKPKSEIVNVASAEELMSEKEKKRLMRKEKTSRGISNVFSKIFSMVFTLVVIAWVTVCLVDFFQVQGNNEPLFCISNKTVKLDKGTIKKCNGLGYKVLGFDKVEGCNVKLVFGPFWLEDKCPIVKK